MLARLGKTQTPRDLRDELQTSPRTSPGFLSTDGATSYRTAIYNGAFSVSFGGGQGLAGTFLFVFFAGFVVKWFQDPR